MGTHMVKKITEENNSGQLPAMTMHDIANFEENN
jgi:hypothetical protein